MSGKVKAAGGSGRVAGADMYERERQDLSGHVCFDNMLSSFYTTSELRANSIVRAHATGAIRFKPSRNPVRAEATPRREVRCFDFSIPPTPEHLKPKELWKYGDEKTAILSNKLYRDLNRIEAKKLPVSVQPPLVRSDDISACAADGSGETVRTGRLSDMTTRSSARSAQGFSSEEAQQRLLDTHISEFKHRVGRDPAMLARWRVEKAAKFIEHQRLKSAHRDSLRSDDDAARNIRDLRARLSSTEQEIHLQETRLALARRPSKSSTSFLPGHM